MLYELGSVVLNREYDEIVLDLTHGINFMPALTLRVAYRLASILLVAYRELGKRGIRILVYNSDPHRYDREEYHHSELASQLIAYKRLDHPLGNHQRGLYRADHSRIRGPLSGFSEAS